MLLLRHTNRRAFITLLGGAVAAWPLAARAQQPENPVRIGFLPVGSQSNSYDRSLVEAFRLGLRELGVVENRHVVLDVVWINNEPELPQAVKELMRRGAKLLIPCGTSASVAAKQQVSTIPIVFINVGNPIGVGLVESLQSRKVKNTRQVRYSVRGGAARTQTSNQTVMSWKDSNLNQAVMSEPLRLRKRVIFPPTGRKDSKYLPGMQFCRTSLRRGQVRGAEGREPLDEPK